LIYMQYVSTWFIWYNKKIEVTLYRCWLYQQAVWLHVKLSRLKRDNSEKIRRYTNEILLGNTKCRQHGAIAEILLWPAWAEYLQSV